jgi:4-aminobutyrate aminotransferase
MGSVTFTASKAGYHRGFYPLLNGVVHVPFPDPYRPVIQSRPGEEYGETIVRYIEEEILGHLLPPTDVAGVLVEPIQGEGGYIIPAPGFFPALRKLCDRYNMLLLVDEVQSGMGRTGKWWAIEHFDVEPDIVCAAKGIASGVPLGAMIAREGLMSWPRGSHGNTFGGNPLACAAALASIQLIEQEYLHNATEMGDYFQDILHELMVRHPNIGEVRGKGLMIGVEFVQDRQTKVAAEKLRDRVVDLAFSTGLLTLGCGKSVIRFAPPLSISRSEIDEGIEIFERARMIAEKEPE